MAIMKRIMSIAIAAVVVLTQFVMPVTAAAGRYATDFETTASYNWFTVRNNDTSGEATTDWAEVVTKAYGSNTENKAMALKTGANYTTEAGGLDTGSYGTVVDNPLVGNCVISIDFMADSAGFANLGDWEMIRSTSVQLTSASGSAEQYIFNFLKYSANRGLAVCLPDSNNTQIGTTPYIPYDIWSNITISFNIETGMASYTVTKNVDTANPEVVGTAQYRYAEANAKTGIDRLKINLLQSNSMIYFDNVEIYSYEPTELVASTPVSGAQDFMPMDTISLKFNNEIEALNLSIGAAPIPAGSWVEGANNTYTYKPTILAWNTDYTLSGTATDIYGNTIAVSVPFKTAVQPENLIEIVGFYEDDNGDTILAESEKLTALEDGTITAKLRFWQTQEASYTYFMGFYRDNGGIPEMIDVVADTVTSSEVSVDKTLQLTVPTEYSDCYIRLFFLNNLTDRTVFGNSVTVGNTTLR